MSIIVEHEKRRGQILKKALDVFMDEGFEDATFQKIADRCGITRTTLYIYFKNKREIFNYSIKQLLLRVEEEILTIRADKAVDSVTRITKVLMNIFQALEENRRLLSVVLDYLLHFSKNGADPETRVRRRTLKLRHILSSMVIEGVKAGDLKKTNVKTADDLLYGFIEAAIFHLVVLKRENLGSFRDAVIFAVKLLAVEQQTIQETLSMKKITL